MKNDQLAKQLIRQFAGQESTLTIPAVYVRYAGSIECGLFLHQVIFWSDRSTHGNGWFHKTYTEWKEEIFLTEYACRKYAKLLSEKGILQTKVAKANGIPTVWYRFDFDVFEQSLIEFFNSPEETERSNPRTQRTETANSKDRNCDLQVSETANSQNHLYIQKITTEDHSHKSAQAREEEREISINQNPIELSEPEQPIEPQAIIPGQNSSLSNHGLETQTSVAGDNSSAAAQILPEKKFVDHPTAENDRAFTVPQWGAYSNPDAGFIKHLQKVYLPTVPSYQGKTITEAMAESWLLKAKRYPDRFELAEIQWRDYQRCLRQREEAERLRNAPVEQAFANKPEPYPALPPLSPAPASFREFRLEAVRIAQNAR